MESLAGIVRAWIEKEMSRPDWERHRLDFVQALWPVVVGRSLAERTKPVAWEADGLRVAVPDAAWRRQMEALAGVVLAAIGRWFPQPIITRLGFVVDANLCSSLSRSGERIAKAQVNPSLNAAWEETDLPLEAIHDDELRELVRKIAGLS